MFTGLVEEIGTVQSIKNDKKSAQILIKASKIFNDLKLGDSVCANGVCLTVTTIASKIFTVDVMHETLKRSNLGQLKNGSVVNLERAIAANGRLGGHIVSGHIDGTGQIAKIQNDGIAYWYTVKTSAEIMRYIIEKGSITIDGISLTVGKVEKNSFAVSIIPHTLKETILSNKKIGDTVNLENDIVGKYVAKLLPIKQGITKEFLLKNGF